MRHLRLPSLRLVLGLAAAVVAVSAARAQGSLTPPGAPGPTMMRLDQINGRIPLVTGAPGVAVDATSQTITISQSGSYYLTENLRILPGGSSYGITIASDDVTLDLNGYTINSTVAPAAAAAIGISGAFGAIRQNIVIRNGIIRSSAGSGFRVGIGFGPEVQLPVKCHHVLIEKMLISGMNTGGINVAYDITPDVIVRDTTVADSEGYGIINAHLVENCQVLGVGMTGITAVIVRNCTARVLTGDGISADNVTDSRGTTGSSGYGVKAANRAVNCQGSSAGIGLSASTAVNSQGYSSGAAANGAIGLRAFSLAQNCTGDAEQGIGLRAKIAIGCDVASGTADITHKYNMP